MRFPLVKFRENFAPWTITQRMRLALVRPRVYRLCVILRSIMGTRQVSAGEESLFNGGLIPVARHVDCSRASPGAPSGVPQCTPRSARVLSNTPSVATPLATLAEECPDGGQLSLFFSLGQCNGHDAGLVARIFAAVRSVLNRFQEFAKQNNRTHTYSVCFDIFQDTARFLV